MKIDSMRRRGYDVLAGITLTKTEEARAHAAGHALATSGLSSSDLLRILAGLEGEIRRLEDASLWTDAGSETEKHRMRLFQDSAILYTAVRLAQVWQPQAAKGDPVR